ncbi:hypothetical protein V5N11_022284 [Cardamine amara subsp. amara]|uniref:DUF1985 domain-containing protein n=1 Tax=Cardamine amara subsp. amara TaxID=228776 RepID=A0ABD1BF92_CARAN
MPKERTKKCMGFWLLSLRTARLGKRKVWWFVVNRVPVRYSLWEHSLISGLNCRQYPENHEQLGSLRFVQRLFNRRKYEIKLTEVENKLTTMIVCEDRLKRAVLYFLGSVMKKKSKSPQIVEPFLLRIVDDLDECKKFPWERYTFEDCSHELEHMLDHFKDKVQSSWAFPGFIVRLEVIQFKISFGFVVASSLIIFIHML